MTRHVFATSSALVFDRSRSSPRNHATNTDALSIRVVLKNARVRIDQAVCSPSWSLMTRLLYRFLAQLARLAVRSGRSKDLQIIVLRHENTVLRRQVGRPALTDDDRTLLGAIAAALPKALRQDWIVTPETLLR